MEIVSYHWARGWRRISGEAPIWIWSTCCRFYATGHSAGRGCWWTTAAGRPTKTASAPAVREPQTTRWKRWRNSDGRRCRLLGWPAEAEAEAAAEEASQTSLSTSRCWPLWRCLWRCLWRRLWRGCLWRGLGGRGCCRWWWPVVSVVMEEVVLVPDWLLGPEQVRQSILLLKMLEMLERIMFFLMGLMITMRWDQCY